jgi:hypothetical protein
VRRGTARRYPLGMPKRQFVFTLPAPRPGEAAPPLGTPAALVGALSAFNTAPDGGPSKALGTQRLHGPGFVVDIPDGQPQITQAMITVTEEDTAWPVLVRICKSLGWKMVDLESGRSFG